MAKELSPIQPIALPRKAKDGYTNGAGKLLSRSDFIETLNEALLHYHKHSDSTLANTLVRQNSHLIFGATKVHVELVRWFCQYAPLRWDGEKLVKNKSPSAPPLLTKDESAAKKLLLEAKNNPPSLIRTSLDVPGGFFDLKGKEVSRNEFVHSLYRALRHFHDNGDSTWATRIVAFNSTNPRSSLHSSLINWFLTFSPLRWDKTKKALKKDRASALPLFQTNPAGAELLLEQAKNFPFDHARFKKQREQSSIDEKFFYKIKKFLREYEKDKKENRIPSNKIIPILDVVTKIKRLKREAEGAIDSLKSDQIESAFGDFHDTLLEYLSEIQGIQDSSVTLPVDHDAENLFENLLAEKISDGEVKSLITFITNVKVGNLVKKCRKIMDDDENPQLTNRLKRFLNFIKPQLMLRGTDAFLEIGHDDWFKWPSTEVYADLKSLRSSSYDNLTQEGFLKFVGYEVGKTRGKSEGERHHLLHTAFELHIPNGESIWSGWGPRISATRLKRMSHSIAYFVRNEQKNPQGDYSQAIEEHLRDLEFLYDEYYVGHFNFEFPTIATVHKLNYAS